MHRLLICLVLGSLAATAHAEPPRSAEPEVYRGPVTPPATLKSGIVGIIPSVNIALPPPSAEELATLDHDAVPPVVGFGRSLPTADQQIPGSRLTWHAGPGGDKLAAFSVRSPWAASLRLQLDLADMPAGVELRFFSPIGTPQVAGLVTTGEPGIGDGLWSPSVTGDTIAVEISVPAHLDAGQLSIIIPRVSHIASNPAEPTPITKSLDDIGASERCHIDVQCAEIPDVVRNSVAKMLITTPGGGTGLCTGTLLADTDPNTQIPYFLTAHHCGVGDPRVAANIEFYWFFERTTCNGANPDTVARTLGGGVPLSSAQRELGNDHALLQLNQAPPNGAAFSGWTADRARVGNPILGVHHPVGDLKKVSGGQVVSYVSTAPGPGNQAFFFTSPDNVGPYLEIQWQNGVTQGGSSGSSVWLASSGGASGGPYVVGALLGGSSRCRNPRATDIYGDFALTYKASRQWLAGSADYTTIWQDQSRSGQGVQLLQNGNTIQGAWYTYDGNGNPMWLTFVASIANGSASAPLLRFTGPGLGSPWTNPSFAEAGQANLIFNSPTSVTFNYGVDGVNGSLALTPFTSLAAGGYTGVWWDPSTPGQGVQLIQRGTQLSGAWYLYDANGSGQWFTFMGEYPLPGRPMSTNLQAFKGPPLGQPWNPNQVQSTAGGQISVSANSPTSLAMAYTIGNAQGTLNLVPFNP